MMEQKNAVKTGDVVKAAREENKDGNNSRIVIAGKGGVGKTTLAADEDPQQDLIFSLGFPTERAEEIVPISRNLYYIEEKTGAMPGQSWGVMLNLNPDVSDVVERFGMRIGKNINILVMGRVLQAATGCLCPENSLFPL
ncbi:MAG: hypothetical protein R6U13_03555 [Desulfatiglandaceae bacterium]